MEYLDKIKYVQDLTGDILIFNFKTWMSVIKGVIVKYTDKTEIEASFLINEKNFKIPVSYDEVIFYSHEIEYHWAMLLVHGEGYWQKGISADEPFEYNQWESKYRVDNSLEIESFEFID